MIRFIYEYPAISDSTSTMPINLNRRQFLVASGATAGLAAAAQTPLRDADAEIRPVELKVDYVDRPLGLESSRPSLSWRTESNKRNVSQIAYRVLVASTEEALESGKPDLWDSGKIETSRSLGIEYQGRTLSSRERCYWRVQAWYAKQSAPVFSAVSWWEMGLLLPTDWTAQWLAAETPVERADREFGLAWIWDASATKKGTVHFRGAFQLPTAAANAKVYVARHGHTQVVNVWIDGKPIENLKAAAQENDWITLEPMTAGAHLIAVEMKVTEGNALAANGPHSIPALAAFLRFEEQQGKVTRVGSGPTWRTTTQPGTDWYKHGYDDNEWTAAVPTRVDNYQPLPAEPAINLRHAFAADKPLLRARLYVTALGAYEAWLNGKRVGDALLAPESSQYAERVLYRAHDVTSMVQRGANAIGLTVGDGWYASFNTFSGRYTYGPPPRRVLAQLELTFTDGSRQVVATGPGWRTGESPIRKSQVRIGETYDARLEQAGWQSNGFDDSRWHDAQIIAAPASRLTAQIAPPIRVQQTLKPRSISQPKPGTYVFDFGRCFAGFCRVRAQGARGTRIELRFAELLSSSGEPEEYWLSIGEPKSDVFVLRGASTPETFQPHFSYRGFRYVQVTGLPSPPTADSIEGVAISSDLQATGRLRTSAPLIEQIWRNTVRSQQSNFVGIPTDCPSREQLGYTADAGAFWDAAAFNMDVCAFTSRYMDGVVDDQRADGAFPIIAPMPRHDNAFFDVAGSPPGWGDGGIILPWVSWQRYGDVSTIQRHWRAMARHVQFVLDSNPDHLWKNKRSHDFGDWLSVNQTSLPNTTTSPPRDLIGTAYWAHSTNLLAQMALAIGRREDADRLNTLADSIRRAFNAAYVRADGTIGDGSQTCYVLALRLGLLPASIRKAAAERLATDVRNRGIALTTGFLGTQFILDVLADAGFADLAYGLLLRTEFPSWGYMIGQGAETIWENWAGTIMLNGTSYNMSKNHYSLGGICGFLFRRVAGIDAAAPGFEKVLVRPIPDARVNRGGGDYDSIMGRISTDWALLSDGAFKLDLTIPANAVARVHLPAKRTSRITEGRIEISRQSDIKVIQRGDDEAVIDVGSGRYGFLVETGRST